MGRRRRQQVGHSSDIAFLLIIFFLVMVGSTANRALMIEPAEEIPSTERLVEDEAVKADPILLEILMDGSIHVAPNSVGQALSIVEGKDVVVYAHEGVRWDQVIDVLDTLSVWDVSSIGFANEMEEP